MKIAFHKDGDYGSIAYDEGNQDVLVTHKDPKIRSKVYDYLTSKRPFDVPTNPDSPMWGGYVQVDAEPTEDRTYMGMALAEMHFNTGIHVDWNHTDNRGYLDNGANGGEEEGVQDE